MKVPITDKFFLTSDAHNIILNEVFIIQEGTNKGKEWSKSIGFYPSIVAAFEGLLRQKGMRSKARTLNGLITEYNDLIAKIKRAFPTVRESLERPDL